MTNRKLVKEELQNKLRESLCRLEISISTIERLYLVDDQSHTGGDTIEYVKNRLDKGFMPIRYTNLLYSEQIQHGQIIVSIATTDNKTNVKIQDNVCDIIRENMNIQHEIQGLKMAMHCL